MYKQQYFIRFGTDPVFYIQTNKKVAIESPDHYLPRGAINDNSPRERFNCKLYELMEFKDQISLMDLGCAGGGFVRSLIDDGHLAVGLEGSYHPKYLRLGEWNHCPLHLFTCDITSQFKVMKINTGMLQTFDVITAWEVLEHIPEHFIKNLFNNIACHLKSGGYFIGSVAQFKDENPLTGAVYHKTIKSKKWWMDQVSEFGFSEVLNHPFEPKDYLRGHGEGLTEWFPGNGMGFHMVLQFGTSFAPPTLR